MDISRRKNQSPCIRIERLSWLDDVKKEIVFFQIYKYDIKYDIREYTARMLPAAVADNGDADQCRLLLVMEFGL